MTTTKIPQLAPLTTALDGTEEFELARASLSRRITSINLFKVVGVLPATDGSPTPVTGYRIPLFRVSDGQPYSCTLAQALTLNGNVPPGGTTGQSLIKASDADYDTEWSSGGFLDQTANTVFSGPTSGAAAAPAFRALVGADLPNPAASTKGGVYSYAAVSNQFLTQIGTDGSVTSAQPAFSNISGTATVAQGGTGAVSQTAYAVLCGGITGTGAYQSVLSVGTTGQALVSNGAGALPTFQSLSTAVGQALTKLDDTNVTLTLGGAPSTALLAASSITAGWTGQLSVARGGTGNSALGALTKTDDTNVTLALGGSPTTALVNAASLTLGWTGTLAVSRGGIGVGTLASNGVLLGNDTSAVSATAVGATGEVLAGNTAAAPTFQGVSAVIDNLGSTQGQILYRNGSAWVPLNPGTAGEVLQTGGAGANPSWTSVGGTGTVTSVDASGGTTGMSFTGGPVTTSGTLTLTGTLAVANGGTGITAFGTGVATALGVNVGSAGAFVTFNGALGTPSSGTLTNCTGLPVAGGGTGVSSTTAYAVLCGGTTSTAALQSIASVGTAGQVLTSNGAGALPTFQNFVPYNFLTGLTLSRNSGTPTTQIDMAIGQAADSTNAVLITTTGVLTADCTTTGANGLDTGSLANNTWYHVYLIALAAGATPAILVSTSASSPTMPGSYIYKRRIGSVKTNGSAQFIAFTQDGNYFVWATALLDVNTTNPGTSAVTPTLTVPTGVNVHAIMNVHLTASPNASRVIVSDLATTDVAPSSGAAAPGATTGGNVYQDGRVGPVIVRTNTSAQVRYRCDVSDGGVTMRINTIGWWDYRNT